MDELISPVENLLLRVSKDIPNATPCNEIFQNFEDSIKPLFIESDHLSNLVKLQLIGFGSQIVNTLNTVLVGMEDSNERRQSRVGSRIRHDSLYGLLITNMSPEPGRSCTFEIKPKWLCQSPNAPKLAIRCRTCALSAYRNRELEGPVSSKKWPPCPLELVSDDLELVASNFTMRLQEQKAFNQQPVDVRVRVMLAVEDYFTIGKGRSLLKRIEELQRLHDPEGVLGGHALGMSLCKDELPSGPRALALRMAMTLRDCSMFVRVHFDDKEAVVEARLADLDLKSEDKIEEWFEKERDLVLGGWYLGTERDLRPQAHRAPAESCVMARKFSKKVPLHLQGTLV
ncbi:hypothetical protein K432DRAFT_377497 [Lepidopterella palustris CBS 459.81]|uniref:Inositol-pentakisphosphate 2-kinase n=1 Tax=Lepidopterella palustris CBS 459.81 TaxID=1314670 RepID=A0A8E2JK42_9PEZI|nr:hypothetical protein K432DRAFT_377497 [Lepidopterella palustris CBS 459.81]